LELDSCIENKINTIVKQHKKNTDKKKQKKTEKQKNKHAIITTTNNNVKYCPNSYTANALLCVGLRV